MRELDASLSALHNSIRDEGEWRLAARYAPLIRLDSREPFRPLVAGYSILYQDAPSPSFSRTIRLSGGRKPTASFAIEYAIWWDWDINHLYELEHIWVYVNASGQVTRIEGSWHGEVKDLTSGDGLRLNGERPVVRAAPGKHGFASSVSEFQAHQSKLPGITTRFAGASGIAVNGLFAGEISRTPPWDRLIQSYLADFAFVPSWDFSVEFSFKDEMLVSWVTLREWIPGRVRAWLAQLEREITSERYRFLRTSVCSSLSQIRGAGKMGMDMVQLGVGRNILRLPVLTDERGKNTRISLLTALQACRRALVGVYLTIHDRRVIPWLARILGRGDWSDYLMTGAMRPAWLAEIKARLPHYRSVLMLAAPPDNVLAEALAVGANYVHLTKNAEGWLTPASIQTLRQAGIGIVCGPVQSASTLDWLRSLGIEAIVVRDPACLVRLGE